jgi:ribosome biogenesis GTPase / thiamine phosphate phosphatase
MELEDLGWNPFFKEHFETFRNTGLSPLRVTRENRGIYMAYDGQNEWTCEISGKFRFEAGPKSGFPAVGDWIAAVLRHDEGKATIHALLPRKSAFLRKVAGRTTEEQVVASNIDVVFIVCGLDLNYNLRRVERYLALSGESGAKPVILLNKADLCPEAELRRAEVASIAAGTDIHVISAFRKNGLEAVTGHISKGATAAFLGSSGAGKSTIINSLLGTEKCKVNDISGLGARGKHTTTFRELIVLPNGGMVIDTPGMRELQVWGNEEGFKQTFEDIEELGLKCRFRDCGHQTEPGCAIKEAVSNGSLDGDRLKSFLKLQKEYRYLSDRQTMKASAVEKARWKSISKLARNMKNKYK